MNRYVLSDEAASDLRDIIEFIAEKSERAALRVAGEFSTTFRGLAQMPLKGHRRRDLTERDDLLFWPVWSYLVIYRPDPRPLEIVAVLHGKRDIERVLRTDR
jgi:plasmid stabilization system protein ParE